MTLAELRDRIEGHAPGSMIPRDWILEELGRATGEPVGVQNWVDVVRAAEITGESAKFLAARAVHWRGASYAKIRVRKNNPDNLRSHWLFAEEDCWTYARENGAAAPVTVPDATDPDDEEAILSHYAQKAVANL